MSFQLTGDQLKTGLRRLGDIQRQLGQAEYPHDPDKMLNALQAVGEGQFQAVGGGVLFPCQVHAPELIPQGYTVLEDVMPSEFKVEELEFPGFLEGKERLVGGRVMRGRAVMLEANLGLADGKKILAEQTKIPADLRGYYIVLSGTLLRLAAGDLYVACLYWHGDRWVLDFRYLGDAFRSSARLPRRK